MAQRNNSAKQTNEWQLKGATYKKGNAFYHVGDNINNQTELSFNVNGVLKTVTIPEPLKSLNSIYDEVKNGIVHYNTKTFIVDHTTVLFAESTWAQTDNTSICYCYMPYDVQANTPILCDKLGVISDMITKSEECGVKVVNKVLAIRLANEDLGILNADDSEAILKKFNAYLKENAFTVIYCLAQPISKLLEDYAFDIYSANNVITCSTQQDPSYFNVTYPIDVIINTTIDPKEMQALAAYVKEAKAAVDAIKTHLDSKSDVIDKQYETIKSLNTKIEKYAAEIEISHTFVSESKKDISAALETIKTLKTQTQALKEEVAAFVESIQSIVNQHNESVDSHADIRQENADSYATIREEYQAGYSSLQEEMQLIEQKIDFDFGSF